jgi:hypothetical protein
MALTLQELDSSLLHRWNELIDRFEQATVFHTMEWLTMLTDVLRVEFRPYGLFGGEEIIGVFPVFFTKKAMFHICASPLSGWTTPYLGPLIDPCRLGEVIAEFSEFLRKKGADYSEIVFSRWVDTEPLEQFGFTCEERTTYILDLLDSEEAMWDRLDGGCRRAIRKGMKSGLEVVDGDLTGEIDRYYEMVIDVYEKSNRPPPMPKRFYETLVSHLNGRLKVLFVRHNGRTIAGGIFPWYRETIYYIDGASDTRSLDLRPNNLLQWELIRWASQNGLKVYDMIGADIPSIARFKAGFGPRLVGYTYAYRSTTTIASLGRMVYKKGAPFVRALHRRLR